MENFNNLEQKSVALEVTENSKIYLRNTAPWSKFMAILQFIVVGFMALSALIIIVAGSAMSAYLPISISFIGWIYLALAIVIFIPARYLYRFSQKAVNAVEINNTLELEEAFKNMKSYWKFTGIMTIVVIVLSLTVVPIIAIATIAGGAFAY
ncbi:MAG: hypothetical protein FWC34_01620 [Bacteroidetes bacterium]|nr:hypothetical protein [Bacteroidota bacterium]MCL2303237.1 hypothetical protein [Lentimicrobiaceae bacterium]